MMTLSRHISCAAVLALLASVGFVSAEQTQAQMRERALELPLPESVTDLIERGFARRQVGFAMQDLYALFAIRRNIGGRNDGLNADNRDFALMLSLARRRAALIETALIYDHNADGTVTAAEVNAHFRGNSTWQAEDLFGIFDMNFDDEITPEEMRMSAVRMIDDASNVALLDQILTWDLNDDGQVHIDEVQMMSDARFRPLPGSDQ